MAGFEPATSPVSGERSNQLSYTPILGSINSPAEWKWHRRVNTTPSAIVLALAGNASSSYYLCGDNFFILESLIKQSLVVLNFLLVFNNDDTFVSFW